MTYSLIDTFKLLFFCLTDSYYLDDTLIEGHYITESDYSKHLTKESVLRLVPQDKTRFISITFGDAADKYSEYINFPFSIIGKYGYLFFKESIPIESARNTALYFLQFYGIKNTPDDILNLPDVPEDILSFTELLEKLDKKRIGLEDIPKWAESLPCNDAPPCVQTYYLTHDCYAGFCSPYLQANGVSVADNRFTLPYECEKIDKNICDKKYCSSRKYKPGGRYVSAMKFEQLTQYNSSPVYYTWMIDGKETTFENELDIIRQDRFQSVCFRQLGKLPTKVNPDIWYQIVNRALNSIVVVESETINKTKSDILKEILITDMKDKTLVGSYYEYERLMQGYLYLDPVNITLIICPEILGIYVSSNYKDFKLIASRICMLF